ncbi:MAG TPA: hypothetical protein VM870_07730, partial [Pyrinomonadaceae bacterium]|nr:hypothetical protein [Pyrinomonadaceae bacterium]
VGLITFYASYPATGSASDEFAKMWRARVEPTLPGTTPRPQIGREGDYATAVGGGRVDTQGEVTTIALATIVGRGRAIGVLTMATGDEVLREVTTFLDAMTVTPGAQNATTTTTPSASAVPTGSQIEVEFVVPPGYQSKREGSMILLIPTTFTEQTPCAYGISPSRPSSGNLEADARAALLEPHPGWKLKDDSYTAMRGTAGGGWKYFWLRAGIENFSGGSYQYVNAMAMAFPAEPGRVNIVWGVGNAARCQLDDLAFAQLFHSLRPRGWTSDGGRALAQALQGLWRFTHNYGVTQYKFTENGQYEYGRGTITTTGMLETTSSKVSDGSYKFNGSELMLGNSRFRIRVYDKYIAGKWWRMMSLLDENAKPASEVEYERIQN